MNINNIIDWFGNRGVSAYDMPINKYKIKPSEITFLSANTWDVSGGGNYGYDAIWVNRNKNTFDNLDYSPKHEINDLKGLIEIVK